MYHVHGLRGHDPTEPPASGPYPCPPVSNEPRTQQLFDDLTAVSYHPFPAPCAIMLDEQNIAHSTCIRCQTCDGYPCLVHAKADAEIVGVRPALTFPTVTLLRHAKAIKLETNAAGTAVTSVVAEVAGEKEVFRGDIIVVSCGAANTAKLLLDEYGTVWSSAADGVHCISPDGELLGRIFVPHTVANVFHWRLDNTIRYFLELSGRTSAVTSVQKLSRIALICRQADRLAEFYIRGFGFARIEDSPKIDPSFTKLIGLAKGQARITFLHLGNQVIELAETQPPGCSYPGDVPGWNSLFQHFAIVVSDMTAAYANLQALHNWTPISTEGPQILAPSSGGVTAFKFRDPEGHPLEMLAFAPGATPAHWANRATPVWALIIPQFGWPISAEALHLQSTGAGVHCKFPQHRSRTGKARQYSRSGR